MRKCSLLDLFRYRVLPTGKAGRIDLGGGPWTGDRLTIAIGPISSRASLLTSALVHGDPRGSI